MFAFHPHNGSDRSAPVSPPSQSGPHDTPHSTGARSVPGQDARKRKRNTIACFQCRSRKRRCEATSYANCESCAREGLECRRPDTDGRKIRWQKSSVMTGTGSGETVEHDTSGSTAHGHLASHGGPDIDGAYLDSLFDLIMGSGSSRLDATQPQAGPSTLNLAPTVDNTQLSAHVSGTTGATFRSSPLTLDDNSTLPQFHNPLQPYATQPSDLSWMAPLHTSPNGRSSLGEQHRPEEDGVSPRALVRPPHVKKVVWWRSHGPSAIAPGLKRITLKVRLDNKIDPATPTSPLYNLGQANPTFADNLVDEGGMPRRDLMLHLLDIFMVHFGCQYPALSVQQLKGDVDRRTGSTLLFNCIASTASRFSSHPALALSGLEPHAYGTVFLKTAKDLLGNMMAVPTRETVIALVLLAGISHGIGSESEEWMMAGMAVRMAIDLGLHLAHPPQSTMSDEDRRLDRLTFWSVYFLDVSLSFGVGRETAFRIASVTQTIPADSDFADRSTGPIVVESGSLASRNVFAHAANLAFVYGPLVNVVNGPRDDPIARELEIQRITQQAVEVYNALPHNLQWSAYNLQNLSKANQGSIFVQMHLWMHTILVRPVRGLLYVELSDRTGFHRGTVTPSNATATRLWQNSARTIGDILILCDIVNPFAYHALPFSNQPFVVAGCCYIKEADAQHQVIVSTSEQSKYPGIDPSGGNMEATYKDTPDRGKGATNSREEKAEIYWTLLRSVVSNNIATLQQGLKRQTRYWAGVAWVAEVLAQRISGVKMNEIDLEQVTKGLDSTVTIPDARMFGPGNRESHTQEEILHSSVDTRPQVTAPFDFLLPLEADWMADSELLQSTGYSVMVENFTADWSSNALQ